MLICARSPLLVHTMPRGRAYTSDDTCSVEGCNAQAKKGNMCIKHYCRAQCAKKQAQIAVMEAKITAMEAELAGLCANNNNIF